MLAHKSVSHSRSRTISSFYLFMALAALLIMLALALPGAFKTTSDTPTVENNFKTYSNSRYGYSIAYPINWQIVDQAGQGVFTAASSIAQDQQGGTNFSQRQLLQASATASPIYNFSKVDVVAYDLESELSAHDFLLAKSSMAPEGRLTDVKVAGRDALKLQVQPGAVLENHQDGVLYTTVFVTSGKHGYIIAGFAAASVFDHILESFQTF